MLRAARRSLPELREKYLEPGILFQARPATKGKGDTPPALYETPQGHRFGRGAAATRGEKPRKEGVSPEMQSNPVSSGCADLDSRGFEQPGKRGAPRRKSPEQDADPKQQGAKWRQERGYKMMLSTRKMPSNLRKTRERGAHCRGTSVQMTQAKRRTHSIRHRGSPVW